MLKTIRILTIIVLAGGMWLNTYGQITGLAVAPGDLNSRGEVDVQNADITWDDYLGEDHYFIDIRTGSAAGPSIFGFYPVNPVPANTISHTITDLLIPGTTYYFVIEARDAGDVLIPGAEASLSFIFAGAPDDFDLTAPADGAVDLLYPGLTLSWDPAEPSAGGGIVSYDVQYYEGAGSFPGTTLVTGPFATTSITFAHVNVFSLGATVNWRVLATDANGSTISLSSRSFSMYDPRTYPVDGSTGHPLRPRFEWDDYPGSDYHQIVVDDNDDFSSPLLNVLVFDSLFYDLTFDLDNNTTYYWRIRADIGGPVTAWSTPWAFTTTTSGKSGISYPVPNYPTNGAEVYVADPLLSWYLNISQVGITSYHLEYKEGDDDFSIGPVYSETSTNLFFQLVDLTASTDYYWRVRAYNGSLNLWSAWSDTAHFTTNENISGAPTKPTPLYPVNNVIVYHDDTPLLHWYVTSFNLDLRFDVEVERVDAGPVYVPVFSGSTTTSQFYLEVGTQLEAGEQYRWRVRTTKTG
ncbi:MAG: fibronectin type III domain-containing protein, partial [Ignavibacteriaceae bacterium]